MSHTTQCFSTYFLLSCSIMQSSDPGIREATITIKDARFKRLLYNSPYNQIGLAYVDGAQPNDAKDEFRPVIENLKCYYLATYKDQEYVTKLQAQYKELPQYPILLLTSGKDTKSIVSGFVGMSYFLFNTSRDQFMICAMPLELYEGDVKKFFINHELGHLRDLKTFSQKFREHPFGYTFHQKIEPYLCILGLGVANIVLTYNAIYNDIWFINRRFMPFSLTIASLLPYLTTRVIGHFRSQASRAMELDCDRYALSLASGIEEKRLLHRGAALFLADSTGIGAKEILHLLVGLIPLFSQPHPSDLYRIYKMYQHLYSCHCTERG